MVEPHTDETSGAGQQRHKQRHNGHATGQSRTLEYVTFAEAKPVLGGRKLIKGWWQAAEISLMYGETGCRKTFLMLSMGLSVALGRNWGGCKVAQGGVVYVAAEAGRSLLNRVCAFKEHYGLKDVDVPFVVVTSPVDLCHITVPKSKKLAEKSDLMLLRDVIEEAAARMRVPVRLIIIDTVARSLGGGDENSPDDMGSFVRGLDLLRDKFKCHVAAVHHLGKDHNRKARGHSSLSCAVDTAIEVKADGEISTATIVKQRDGLNSTSKSFRLRAVEIGRDEDQDPVMSCVVEWTEPPAQDEKGNRKLALDIFKQVLEAEGRDDEKRGRVVFLEDWRKACKEAKLGGENPVSRRQAFNRAVKALTAKNGPLASSGLPAEVGMKERAEQCEMPLGEPF